MSTEGLINVGQAIKHGAFREVTNLKTGKRGKVIDVRGGNLVVQIKQACETWAYEDCE